MTGNVKLNDANTEQIKYRTVIIIDTIKCETYFSVVTCHNCDKR